MTNTKKTCAPDGAQTKTLEAAHRDISVAQDTWRTLNYVRDTMTDDLGTIKLDIHRMLCAAGIIRANGRFPDHYKRMVRLPWGYRLWAPTVLRYSHREIYIVDGNGRICVENDPSNDEYGLPRLMTDLDLGYLGALGEFVLANAAQRAMIVAQGRPDDTVTDDNEDWGEDDDTSE